MIVTIPLCLNASFAINRYYLKSLIVFALLDFTLLPGSLGYLIIIKILFLQILILTPYLDYLTEEIIILSINFSIFLWEFSYLFPTEVWLRRRNLPYSFVGVILEIFVRWNFKPYCFIFSSSIKTGRSRLQR
jgi:hypothetical protein